MDDTLIFNGFIKDVQYNAYLINKLISYDLTMVRTVFRIISFHYFIRWLILHSGRLSANSEYPGSLVKADFFFFTGLSIWAEIEKNQTASGCESEKPESWHLKSVRSID